MKRKIICVSVLFLVLISSIAAGGGIKLLLAIDSSDFKDELAEEIVKHAEADSIEISVKESVRKIKNWPLHEYDAVIVLNRGAAGRMNRTLTKILEEGDYPPMFIVTSYGNPKNSKDNYEAYEAVDGLSTASLKNGNDISEMAGEIMISINKLLP